MLARICYFAAQWRDRKGDLQSAILATIDFLGVTILEKVTEIDVAHAYRVKEAEQASSGVSGVGQGIAAPVCGVDGLPLLVVAGALSNPINFCFRVFFY